MFANTEVAILEVDLTVWGLFFCATVPLPAAAERRIVRCYTPAGTAAAGPPQPNAASRQSGRNRGHSCRAARTRAWLSVTQSGSARWPPLRYSPPAASASWCRGSAQSTASAQAAKRARSERVSLSSVPRSCKKIFSQSEIDPNQCRGCITPVRLPAALPLFAGGLGIMGLLGWRRKRKNAAAVAA
jgi:hypothetical protein